ncbi:MAG: hypothetical protein D6744_06210 [Planctomycetota bacterium]|nr:MAG: hypothetical protein D6744_06210 [Planctomycetota bacterium]
MRAAAIILAISLAPAGRADTLHLRDGTRYSGRLIRETDEAVLFRIELDGGAAAIMRRFPRSHVARVVRTGEAEPPVEAPRAAPTSAGSRRIEQMLREAFELEADGDLEAALRATQAAVLAARHDPEVLARLDRLSHSAYGRPLAALLADLRVRFALRGRGGRVFDLRSATAYESAALARRLESLIAERLSRTYAGRTLREWSDAPEAIESLTPDSPALVRDARIAAAAIQARLKFDRALRRERARRAELMSVRGALMKLAAHVAALPGFTALGAPAGEDPTQAAAEAILRAASQPSLETDEPTAEQGESAEEQRPAADEPESDRNSVARKSPPSEGDPKPSTGARGATP